jgi:hypothetical protein
MQKSLPQAHQRAIKQVESAISYYEQIASIIRNASSLAAIDSKFGKVCARHLDVQWRLDVSPKHRELVNLPAELPRSEIQSKILKPVEDILGTYRDIKAGLSKGDFNIECEYRDNLWYEGCKKGGDGAWIYKLFVRHSDIHICVDEIDPTDIKKLSLAIVHEASHKFGKTTDSGARIQDAHTYDNVDEIPVSKDRGWVKPTGPHAPPDAGGPINDMIVELGEGLVGIPHKIRYGDRVWYLADDYGYTDRKQFVEDVRALNPGIDFNNLKPRDEIFVPTNVENPKLSTPYGLRRDQQASTIPSSLERSEIDEGPQVPQQHRQASTIPSSLERTNLSEMIKVLQGPDEIDEGPQIPLQHRQASTIPSSSERTNLSEMIKVLQRPDEMEDFDEGPQVPLQPQASSQQGLIADRFGVNQLLEPHDDWRPPQASSQQGLIADRFGVNQLLEPQNNWRPSTGPSQWMDQGAGGFSQPGPQVDLRPTSGPPQSPWAQWGLG